MLAANRRGSQRAGPALIIFNSRARVRRLAFRADSLFAAARCARDCAELVTRINGRAAFGQKVPKRGALALSREERTHV